MKLSVAICNLKDITLCQRLFSDRTLDEILDLAALHFKVPREKLTPDDDFFKTLGIDSLQALDLLTRLEHHFPHRFAGLRTAGRVGFPDVGGSDSITAVRLSLLREARKGIIY